MTQIDTRRMVRMTLRLAPCAVLLLSVVVSLGTAHADPVEDFYRGRHITMIVGYGAGSEYDLYARLLGRYLPKYLPGNPGIVPQNMPGASSLAATNYLYNVAPHDGSVIGTFHERMGLEPKMAPEGTRYDGRLFSWIGSMQKQTSVCITWHASGITTIDDMRRRTVIAGGSGVAGSSAVFPALMNNLLGTKLTLIPGYEADEIDRALERREVDSRCGVGWASLKSLHPDWVADHKIDVLVQFALQRHPELPDVPTLLELTTDPTDRDALQLMFATGEMGKPFAAPPNIPADRLAALRLAFDRALQDPGLIAEAAQAQLELGVIGGQQITDMLVRLYGEPDSVYARVAQLRSVPQAPSPTR